MTVVISNKDFSQAQPYHVQIRHAKTYYPLETMKPFAHVQSILCVEMVVGGLDRKYKYHGHYLLLSPYGVL